MLLALSLGAGAQVYDISTGVVNGSPTLITPPTDDDTWEVVDPLGNTVTPKVCNPLTGSWGTTSCSNWITTSVLGGPGYQPSSSVATGDYYFITYVDIGLDCDITSAYLNLNSIALDNNASDIYVNSYLHSPTIASNGTVTTGISINVTGELTTGVNTIIIVVSNTSGAVGLNVCGNLTVNRYTLAPALTINSVSCSGYVAATALGTTGPGTSFTWQMDECDAGGILTVGGYSYTSGPHSGTPTNHLYPAVTCGKYYLVKLTTATTCKSASTSQVVFVPCPPTVNLGADVTICYGGCTTIGLSSPLAFSSYSWTSSGGAIAATTRQINVCPLTTTTYSLTVTNALTGCSTTDNITVNVLPNDPSFSIATNTSNATYYTIAASPNATVLTGLTGFGYAWSVEELVSGSPTFIVSNPSCWWTFSPPTVIANNFNGFDHTVYPYSGTVTLASCSTPTLGKFLYNHTYRITRGTWSNECGWQQYSTTITTVKSLSGGPSVYVTEDTRTPDMSYLMATGIQQSTADVAELFTVYPNPSNGVFTIEAGNSTTATIEVFDAQGKRVKAMQQTGFKFAIDLTGFPKGIYMVNIMSEGKLTSKKIILE